MVDFTHVRLGFAQLKEGLGMPLNERERQARVHAAATYGRFAEELDPVWNQLPELAKAITTLDHHSAVIGHLPAADCIQRLYTSARQLGQSVAHTCGKHYSRVAADPRVKAFFQTVRTFVTRHLSHEVRALQDQFAAMVDRLDTLTADLNQAGQDLQQLRTQTDAALHGPQADSSGVRIGRRAQAARLRSSTANDSPRRRKTDATEAHPRHRAAERAARSRRASAS
jgi:uncharacterized protein YoxC